MHGQNSSSNSDGIYSGKRVIRQQGVLTVSPGMEPTTGRLKTLLLRRVASFFDSWHTFDSAFGSTFGTVLAAVRLACAGGTALQDVGLSHRVFRFRDPAATLVNHRQLRE